MTASKYELENLTAIIDRNPGSATGRDSKIEADCIKAEDGSVTCDTKVVNPASDTKARPYYNPFND